MRTMDPDLFADLVADLADDRHNGVNVGNRLCTTCVDVLGVTGAGIMLMADGEHRGTFGVSNSVISVIEELQFTLGEGPCIDAFTSELAISEPDLQRPQTNRWPAFSGPAVAAGVRAVFGFPLLCEGSALGALDLYLDHPGALDPTQASDAAMLAALAVDTVVALQADAEPGALAFELDSSVNHRAVVHQASGMVSIQLGISVDEARSRIRAHAYTFDQPIDDVARNIVLRRLTLS